MCIDERQDIICDNCGENWKNCTCWDDHGSKEHQILAHRLAFGYTTSDYLTYRREKLR